MSEAVVGSVAGLAREMRARGSSVGIGEVLKAHSALAAVDPADPREAYLALRAAVCSEHADLARFAGAFAACFGDELPPKPPIDPVATAVLPASQFPIRRRAHWTSPIPASSGRRPRARSSSCA